jgi:PAB-dependent poly(A)-specific ribonuclease subunit 3
LYPIFKIIFKFSKFCLNYSTSLSHLKNKHLNHNSQFSSFFQVGGAFLDPFSGTADGARPYSQHKNQILRQQAMLTQNGLLAESLIWTYVIQLTSALRHIHSSALACRTLDPTKILVTSKSRLLLNCGGIFDVITFDPTATNNSSTMSHYQQEDLISLGKIVLGKNYFIIF